MSGRPVRGSILPIVASLLLGVAGCGPSRPARVPAPPVDPEGLTRAVLEVADADGDGLLTISELARVPGLAAERAALAALPAAGAGTPPGAAPSGADKRVLALDADGDNRLSAAEITAWLTGVRDSRSAITPASLRVTSKGKPVGGAVVKLVPEPFMGSKMKPAEGTTDPGGVAMPSIPGSPHRGMNSGVYRVEITGTLPGGKPIPAKYNTSTTLGLAVGNGLPTTSPVEFRLD